MKTQFKNILATVAVSTLVACGGGGGGSGASSSLVNAPAGGGDIDDGAGGGGGLPAVVQCNTNARPASGLLKISTVGLPQIDVDAIIERVTNIRALFTLGGLPQAVEIDNVDGVEAEFESLEGVPYVFGVDDVNDYIITRVVGYANTDQIVTGGYISVITTCSNDPTRYDSVRFIVNTDLQAFVETDIQIRALPECTDSSYAKPVSARLGWDGAIISALGLLAGGSGFFSDHSATTGIVKTIGIDWLDGGCVNDNSAMALTDLYLLD